jgi:putative transposase
MAHLKIWLHIVWATKYRQKILEPSARYTLHKHIRENALKKDIHLDFINGHTDHIHALVSLGAKQCVADVVHLLKGESSFWFNQQKILSQKLEWADGYYAASVSHSQLDLVRDYIKNQENHHASKTFEEECAAFMERYGFDFMLGD